MQHMRVRDQVRQADARDTRDARDAQAHPRCPRRPQPQHGPRGRPKGNPKGYLFRPCTSCPIPCMHPVHSRHESARHFF
jgi:hypothetical protein